MRLSVTQCSGLSPSLWKVLPASQPARSTRKLFRLKHVFPLESGTGKCLFALELLSNPQSLETLRSVSDACPVDLFSSLNTGPLM